MDTLTFLIMTTAIIYGLALVSNWFERRYYDGFGDDDSE